jgi:hypothetical protein
MRLRNALLIAFALAALGCSRQQWASFRYRNAPLTEEDRMICEDLRLDPTVMADLKGRPLYTFSPREVDMYLRYARRAFPDLRERIRHIGEKNIGQPYRIYLLGEFPYELYDPQPLYCLDHSDCVVFSEHTYAMALGHDWPSFFRILQQIRYRDGEIGIMTRNHWTERDWDVNNGWLIEDNMREFAHGHAWSEYHETIRRSVFFMRKFGLGADLPDENLTFTYIPVENLPQVLPELRTGDFVNVIRVDRKNPGEAWAGHTGLIVVGDDGTVNFLHSSPPSVREEPIMAYAERSTRPRVKTPTIGFRFFSLRARELSRRFRVSDADLVLPIPDPDFRKEKGQQEEQGVEWTAARPRSQPASPEATRGRRRR